MSQYSKEINILLEKGAKEYATKNYEAAVESYAEACELYSSLKASSIKGDDDEITEDPELLYLYGQALYQVAVTKNGLFGGTDANGEENNQEEEEEEVEQNNGMFQFSEDVPLAEEEDDEEEEQEAEQEREEDEEEDEEEDAQNEDDEQQSEAEEQQSDFEVAWEILDLSRTLFESKLKILSAPEESSETKDLNLEYNSIKFKISEIYDLLGEISLETENFKQSIEDFSKSLELKAKLLPFNSSLISEIHYKLSLAYEFSFETPNFKELAIEHLQKAIKSIEEREEVDLELIKELKAKLVELQKDEDEKFNEKKKQILQGILGQPSESDASTSASTSAAAAAASAPVNDLTFMVKKRKPKQAGDATNKKQKK